MNWTVFIIGIALLLAFYLFKRAGQLPIKNAEQLLNEGALIIDVRSISEYQSGHLPKVINIPLDNIESQIRNKAKDLNKPILLHCQSGMRSGVACKKLASMGYTNVHNLGSYSRAASLLNK